MTIPDLQRYPWNHNVIKNVENSLPDSNSAEF